MLSTGAWESLSIRAARSRSGSAAGSLMMQPNTAGSPSSIRVTATLATLVSYS